MNGNHIGTRHILRPARGCVLAHAALPEELYSDDGSAAEAAVRRLEEVAQRWEDYLSGLTGAPPRARLGTPQPCSMRSTNPPLGAPPDTERGEVASEAGHSSEGAA